MKGMLFEHRIEDLAACNNEKGPGRYMEYNAWWSGAVQERQRAGRLTKKRVRTSSCEAKWWERQGAQKLWPQGSRATQERSVPRQI